MNTRLFRRSMSRPFRFWFSGCLVVLLLSDLPQAAAADDALLPTVEQRQAVAQLVAMGASISVNGQYQVRSVSFSTGPSSPGRVNDETLALLRAFPKLETITLNSVNITDAGLEHLSGLKILRTVTVINSRVTEAGLNKLKEALPGCRVSTTPLGPGSSTSFGQPTSFRQSLVSRLGSPAIQTQLKLTDEQKQSVAKINENSAALRGKFSELSAKLREAKTEEERTTGQKEITDLLAKQRQDAEDAIKKVLSAEQFSELQRLPQSQSGGFSSASLTTRLRSPSTQTQLTLTDDQKQAITALLDRDAAKQREISEQTSKQRQAVEAEIQKVLSPDQFRQLQSIVGTRDRSSATQSNRPANPTESANLAFTTLDRNADGRMTEEEWSQSRNVRRFFDDAGITLSFPVEREVFVAQYVKAYGSDRGARRE